MYNAHRLPVSGLLACYFGYMAAAWFGQWLMVLPSVPITIWPPNGVILAALLTTSRHNWPGWIAVAALGELSANLVWFHNPILPALGYILANTLEVLSAALVLTRFIGRTPFDFRTLRQVLAFLVVAVLAAPMLGAMLGSAIGASEGKRAFSDIFPFWWLGDATGILIATPLVVSLIDAWRRNARPTGAQCVEVAGIATVLAALAAWELSGSLMFAFLLFIPVLWAALRFELLGSALAALALALFIGLHGHYSPQAAGDSETRHAMLQVLTIVAASMGLIVAAIISEHRAATREVTTLNAHLEQRIRERMREIEKAERRFKATFQNAAVGIAILDPAGTVIQANDVLGRILGRRVSEIEGQVVDTFTHPEDLPDNTAARRSLERGKIDSYSLEKRYLRANGDPVWTFVALSCVRDADGKIDYIIKVVQDISAQKRSEEIRQLLMSEVNHRSKNLLSTIRSIARQTAYSTPEDFVENFGVRLKALAANQDLLVKSGWERVRLEELVRSQLGHLDTLLDSRIAISGPEVLLRPEAAQAVGLTIHELATNAGKHGSLSNSKGRVEISWCFEGDNFHMSWTESGGPTVVTPTTTGFGSVVIQRMIEGNLNGTVRIDFDPSGLVWQFQCDRSSL